MALSTGCCESSRNCPVWRPSEPREPGERAVTNRFEAEKKSLLAAGAKLLASDPEGETLASFADLLFERAAGEDIVEYDPGTLAAIAREAFAFFHHRAGPTAVRVADIADADRAGRSHTAIELSTANRPFIFDSVLGELQALGEAVRLVVH